MRAALGPIAEARSPTVRRISRALGNADELIMRPDYAAAIAHAHARASRASASRESWTTALGSPTVAAEASAQAPKV